MPLPGIIISITHYRLFHDILPTSPRHLPPLKNKHPPRTFQQPTPNTRKARTRIYPTSAPGLHTCLTFIRHQFRPSALFSSRPQKPIQSSPMPLLHSVTRHRLFFSFGRNMPPASSSLASSHIIHTRIYFVHNLYTKTRTAANRAYNLHPH